MKRPIKNTKAKKTTKPKIPYHKKPEDIEIASWQIALRKQFAEMKPLMVTPFEKNKVFGDFWVKSHESNFRYKIAFRGEESSWNYCECLDFKTNQLGTCKHIEAVKLHLKNKNRCISGEHLPAYSSVYLSYKGERSVKIRIGKDRKKDFEKIASEYFDQDFNLNEKGFAHFSELLQKAKNISEDFRCYDDALSFVLEERSRIQRKNLLHSEYPDGKFPDLLKVKLYPYQEKGITFAVEKGRCIIADEMGLGKTIQTIGAAELLRKHWGVNSVLVVCPTSLKYQWKKEIEKFCDASVLVVEGNHLTRTKQYESDEFFKIVSYNSLANDLKILETLKTDVLIMDEAQRLKNWKTQIARAMKRVESDYTFIISGTPLENKLEELYSITQYINPFTLGPYYKFMEDSRLTDDGGKVIGYKNLNTIGEKIKNILIRRRKKDVSIELPERMDKILFVPMTTEQQVLHDECKAVVAQLVMKWRRLGFLSEKDRKRLLLSMSQMRMVCDSTFILDQETRFDTKIDELINILTDLFSEGDEKVVIFSQWKRMTRIVAQELEKAQIKYESLHGGVPSAKRKSLIDNFTEDRNCRVFLSTDAGSTGLNLQAASYIINMDLPWNPAVLEQRIARIHRMGQKKKIQVLNFVSAGTIEEQMLSTLNFKSSMFEGVLDDGEDAIFLENSKFEKLMETVEAVTEEETETTESLFSQDTEKSETSTKTSSKTEIQETDFRNEEETKILPKEKTNLHSTHEISGNPEQLLKTGMQFFAGLAQALYSPESTKNLVESIVSEDKETGKTTLNIPVESKESVMNILQLFGNLMKGK